MSPTTKTAVVLMTALVPTTGHRDLIRFALNLPNVDDVVVFIQARSFEPVPSSVRAQTIRSEFRGSRIQVFEDVFDGAPQNPGDHDDFWGWWANRVVSSLSTDNEIILVASEPYGVPLAQAIGCEFMPYDIARQINPVKGETVRRSMYEQWDDILPGARRHFGVTATLFGQESTGKTTMAKATAGWYTSSTFVPEYAREYLETVGIDLTQEKMNAIAYGQFAFQKTVRLEAKSVFTVQDTDLYSTIGYSRFGGFEYSDSLEFNAEITRSDVYFLMPDDIPLEPDPIRYGGDVRESTYEFWLDLGHEYGLNIIEVPRGTFAEKKDFIGWTLYDMWVANTEHVEDFVRE